MRKVFKREGRRCGNLDHRVHLQQGPAVSDPHQHHHGDAGSMSGTGFAPVTALSRAIRSSRWRWLNNISDRIFANFDRITAHKTDTNNHGAVSTDFIGGNYGWPGASYEEPEEIFQNHVRWQQGLHWFMTPPALRPGSTAPGVRGGSSRKGMPQPNPGRRPWADGRLHHGLPQRAPADRRRADSRPGRHQFGIGKPLNNQSRLGGCTAVGFMITTFVFNAAQS